VTEQQLLRMAKRRLAILRHAEEITGNVSLTCRYYGISRQCFYTWRRRYDAHGLDGLRDRSHRPQVSPNATRTEVVGKIIYLRQHWSGPRWLTSSSCESGDVGGVKLLEFNRGAPAQGAVASLPVVEDLQVFKDRVGELDTGPPPLAIQQLGLHPGPERLDHRVVIGVTNGAHRGQQPGVLGALGERPGGELRAVIAMDDRLIR
jgi:hypothetical protein